MQASFFESVACIFPRFCWQDDSWRTPWGPGDADEAAQQGTLPFYFCPFSHSCTPSFCTGGAKRANRSDWCSLKPLGLQAACSAFPESSLPWTGSHSGLRPVAPTWGAAVPVLEKGWVLHTGRDGRPAFYLLVPRPLVPQRRSSANAYWGCTSGFFVLFLKLGSQ